jgi:aspartyl/asparaginyl beta-hydroxylase (cupin superfamily)
LTAKAFWDVGGDDDAAFPWARALEEKAPVIVQELDAKLRKDRKMFSADSAWQNQVMGDGWSAFRLQRLGVWNMDNCKEFPHTYELLRELQIPFAVRGVCFARQAPGSGVQPHSDGRNFILTAHLGLKIPSDCWMQVGNEKRGWKEGKLTILDTSFVHSTGNPSSEDRHVLIIDFWHPGLTEAERAALEFVYDTRNKFENGLVPFRKPKTDAAAGRETGIGAWWQSIVG